MRAHILCTVHAGAKLWTHLARAAHQPTWEKTTFWIQISYNKSTSIRKLLDVAMWLESEINPNENTFLGLLKLMYLKRFWTGIVLGIVIVMKFASIFIAYADWGKQGKEKWFKIQHYDYA